MKSFRLEMPYYLIQSYADLSLSQVRYINSNQEAEYPGFKHNFALLGINAAIVEGTLRSIIHWQLLAISEKIIAKGKKAGQSEPDFAERTLTKLRVEVDTSDTWTKLKTNFKFVFGKSVADVATQKILAEIEHLFTIRNRTAHGSSIQLPATRFTANDDEYLFALQSKLDVLGSYLESALEPKPTSIYESLGHKDTSSLFWETTQRFFEKFHDLYVLPSELKKNLDAIKDYKFGTQFMY